MKIEGVAWGTVIAQYVGVLVAVLMICRCYGRLGKYLKWKGLFGKRKMFDFFKLNTDIFFRTVCLVAVNLFFLSFGARQGSLILAVNTLLVQLYILFSYFLDGFAFAGEAICGKYYGASNNAAFQETVRRVHVSICLEDCTFLICLPTKRRWWRGLLIFIIGQLPYLLLAFLLLCGTAFS